MKTALDICALEDIVPGTGVCALAAGRQIAIFRPRADDALHALDNIDPFAQASVLSRGLICEHDGELWVASPLKKQHFRLKDGACLEAPEKSVQAFAVEVRDGRVQLLLPAG